MKRKDLLKVISFIILVTGIVNLTLLSFSYRDPSIQLIIMFIFSLIYMHVYYYLKTLSKYSSSNILENEDDDLNLIGKFSLLEIRENEY